MFTPGEEFLSALVSVDGEIVRQDFSKPAWNQLPAEAIGSWKSQMPGPKSNQLNWAPNDVILHYFLELAKNENSENGDTLYVLALLMIRRRIVQLEEIDRKLNQPEQLALFCPKTETEYQVPVLEPTPARVVEIQDELAKLLFADAA